MNKQRDTDQPDKTALQLAEAIARRVIEEHGNPGIVRHGSVRGAILSVLREHGVWFGRLSETGQGTVQERLPMGDEE